MIKLNAIKNNVDIYFAMTISFLVKGRLTNIFSVLFLSSFDKEIEIIKRHIAKQTYAI